MEPSGLTIAYDNQNKKKLVVVSDNGGIAMMRLPYGSNPTSNDWTILNQPTNKSDKSDEYECACYFSSMGDKVLLGVEGYHNNGNGNYSAPTVVTYDLSSGFKNTTWTLTAPTAYTNNKGMEAMTNISGAPLPTSWALPSSTMPILTAVQAQAGKAYMYTLATTPPSTPVAVWHTIDIPQPVSGQTAKISEMYYDSPNKILYVLYDGGTSNDYLQALSWVATDGNSSTGAPAGITLSTLGLAQLPWVGCEGMVVDGLDVYFSVDNGNDTSHNGVYILTNFVSTLL